MTDEMKRLVDVAARAIYECLARKDSPTGKLEYSWEQVNEVNKQGYLEDGEAALKAVLPEILKPSMETVERSQHELAKSLVYADYAGRLAEYLGPEGTE